MELWLYGGYVYCVACEYILHKWGFVWLTIYSAMEVDGQQQQVVEVAQPKLPMVGVSLFLYILGITYQPLGLTLNIGLGYHWIYLV